MDLDHDACYRALQTRDARFDGKIFTGVTTTGIYCRPVCPARTPRAENVVFYPSAAAAQAAGLRPCLRCRPETAPDLGAWRGASNTVSRALALIEAGALDEGDVEALSDRVGVGQRQLRRLFEQHLGASPIEVAQTRRLHLAKQLIQDTGLTMTEVALGSGFGSVRRFNETFVRLFGRPPGELRCQAAAVASAPSGGVVRLRLPFRPPYDWDSMLSHLIVRAIPGVELVEHGTYARTIELDGDVGSVRVRRLDEAALQAEVRFPKLSALPAILARLRRQFDLVADPQRIGAHLAGDPLLRPLVETRPGLRVPGAWDGFEQAIRAILGQQITVTAAIALAGRMTARFGRRLTAEETGDARLTHAFPRPEALEGQDLAGLGMPGSRARCLSALAAAAQADPHLLSGRGGLEEATARLRALPGIGEWTAQYIALRELREPDAFPAADVALMRAVADAEGRRPTAVELLERSQAWRPWRAYAAQHLWTEVAIADLRRRAA